MIEMDGTENKCEPFCITVPRGCLCTVPTDCIHLALLLCVTASVCLPAKFGANSILGVSLAICKAGAAEKGVPLYRHIADLAGNKDLVLPVPVSRPAVTASFVKHLLQSHPCHTVPFLQAFNVINGGSHAGNRLAMQEFMVLPVGAESFRDALRMGAELYQTLRGVIKEKYGQDATNVGDEGGFAPNIQENSEGERKPQQMMTSSTSCCVSINCPLTVPT